MWVSGGTHSPAHGIPVYHMVQIGWDRIEDNRIPVYHMVQMRRDGHVGQCESVVAHVVLPMGSQCTSWYRWNETDIEDSGIPPVYHMVQMRHWTLHTLTHVTDLTVCSLVHPKGFHCPTQHNMS